MVVRRGVRVDIVRCGRLTARKRRVLMPGSVFTDGRTMAHHAFRKDES